MSKNLWMHYSSSEQKLSVMTIEQQPQCMSSNLNNSKNTSYWCSYAQHFDFLLILALFVCDAVFELQCVHEQYFLKTLCSSGFKNKTTQKRTAVIQLVCITRILRSGKYDNPWVAKHISLLYVSTHLGVNTHAIAIAFVIVRYINRHVTHSVPTCSSWNSSFTMVERWWNTVVYLLTASKTVTLMSITPHNHCILKEIIKMNSGTLDLIFLRP